MPVAVKEAVLKRDEIGQDLFDVLNICERIIERQLSVWESNEESKPSDMEDHKGGKEEQDSAQCCRA